MLSNAFFFAKFRFDTAENEPAKNLQNFRKMHWNFHDVGILIASGVKRARPAVDPQEKTAQPPELGVRG